VIFVHSRNHQQMWKYRRWHRDGITRRLPGTLPAPLWVIRQNRDGRFVVRRIGLQRFLEYARADRATIAIVKCEPDARAYRDRLSSAERSNAGSSPHSAGSSRKSGIAGNFQIRGYWGKQSKIDLPPALKKQ